MVDSEATRPLTEEERELSRCILERGGAEARDYLSQLELAAASTWRCQCGCASFNFKILSGIFIYSSDGTLSGVEGIRLVRCRPSHFASPFRPAKQ
jgi:hypothetical protein